MKFLWRKNISNIGGRLAEVILQNIICFRTIVWMWQQLGGIVTLQNMYRGLNLLWHNLYV